MYHMDYTYHIVFASCAYVRALNICSSCKRANQRVSERVYDVQAGVFSHHVMYHILYYIQFTHCFFSFFFLLVCLVLGTWYLVFYTFIITIITLIVIISLSYRFTLEGVLVYRCTRKTNLASRQNSSVSARQAMVYLKSNHERGT